MKAISLWEPWATWVAKGWKTVETRTHSRFRGLQGQRIAIHAANKWDSNALAIAARFLTDHQIKYTIALKRSRRYGVICTAFVKVHTFCSPNDAPHALIECDTQRFGLFLQDIHPIDPPISIRGWQGIFNVEI